MAEFAEKRENAFGRVVKLDGCVSLFDVEGRILYKIIGFLIPVLFLLCN